MSILCRAVRVGAANEFVMNGISAAKPLIDLLERPKVSREGLTEFDLSAGSEGVKEHEVGTSACLCGHHL
ncbi:MAG TPA: hypothetical protein PKK74_08365 [Candidatus Methanoculleus thermohydrogenotrophicum]|nr:hypothetical protein [Candidatus Methanoculleus thermohydrogenotrophicum]NLM82182.1 hypothetical protein [Candidatus Methanoculleus thermohydrogenotrophicum]HOB18688.1 hypothetical protein [Candidatus Methanoculleus thermohydrogenotrophicum]HPZ38758.1 hypothetical protein [Candidatus Methanoculleus thermohydrogenotrophicum]HQC91930.1 hypothetical protein [Candidatus Methanoculleus thermohydrogenotrophicum]